MNQIESIKEAKRVKGGKTGGGLSEKAHFSVSNPVFCLPRKWLSVLLHKPNEWDFTEVFEESAVGPLKIEVVY